MNRPHATTALASSALALILAAGPALADVTPAEVWQNMRDGYEQMGYQVAIGAEDGSDQRLSLTDVTLTGASEATPQDAPQMRLTMPRIDFEALGDGTVRSVVEGDITLDMRNDAAEGGPAGFSMVVEAPGNETLSSGTPDQMQHNFTIPTLTLRGQAADDANEVPVTATLTGVAGTQSVTRAADGSSSQTYSGRADMMNVTMTASGPSEVEEAPEAEAGTDSFSAEFTAADLVIEGEGASPSGTTDFSNRPSEALEAGFQAAGRFALGQTTGSFTGSNRLEDGTTTDSSGSFEAASGTLAVTMGAEGLSYEGSLTDMATQLTSSDMPFPIAYTARENQFRLAVPVMASEAPQPFALRYVLEDLVLDDAVWQALDPEQTLPRDPARLAIDLGGEAVVMRNLLDAEADPEGQDTDQPPTMPLMPRGLTLNEVALSALGASARMTGALTFADDPSQPVGTLNGDFSGINGLLDRLVQMGVVPQEQLMGPRMMMAMFARPVEGDPDRLQTEIEFREGGSIFANGQQIQ